MNFGYFWLILGSFDSQKSRLAGFATYYCEFSLLLSGERPVSLLRRRNPASPPPPPAPARWYSSAAVKLLSLNFDRALAAVGNLTEPSAAPSSSSPETTTRSFFLQRLHGFLPSLWPTSFFWLDSKMSFRAQELYKKLVRKVGKDVPAEVMESIKRQLPNKKIVMGRAKRGIFAGRHIQFGNKISEDGGNNKDTSGMILMMSEQVNKGKITTCLE
ncbi:hypothetical protein KSP40_PGU019571 [Platanthera guangdongensis]|uniref:Uncharacterized protein n=1 Tax=Platanthera guangdongensis TaxID=2320717 RepID=A0ABR2LGK2_9ASPA